WPRVTAEGGVEPPRGGGEGFLLLAAREPPAVPEGLRALPSLEALRRTWQRHYERTARAPAPPGEPPEYAVGFKASRDLPRATEGSESPYEVAARYRHKRDPQG